MTTVLIILALVGLVNIIGLKVITTFSLFKSTVLGLLLSPHTAYVFTLAALEIVGNLYFKLALGLVGEDSVSFKINTLLKGMSKRLGVIVGDTSTPPVKKVSEEESKVTDEQ